MRQCMRQSMRQLVSSKASLKILVCLKGDFIHLPSSAREPSFSDKLYTKPIVSWIVSWIVSYLSLSCLLVVSCRFPRPPPHPPGPFGAQDRKKYERLTRRLHININININLDIHIKNKYKDKDKENKSAYFTGDDIN